MGADERRQVGRAGLLLAFYDDLDVGRQAAIGLQQGFHGLDMGEDLALVVRDAPRVQPAVAQRRLKWGRVPFADRIGRLHVIMPVDQDGWRGRGP